ncbi:uncharacterized protein LOC118349467 [Juglans regia]|uniref:Uncharacterized protein LOC118349467 n=1 Tax=Juglans regia TaxID=51240 RepID=A0A6P9EQY9_JUGRE|nr:uncharacterized protein LOC118349467 [Juglans regia]
MQVTLCVKRIVCGEKNNFFSEIPIFPFLPPDTLVSLSLILRPQSSSPAASSPKANPSPTQPHPVNHPHNFPSKNPNLTQSARHTCSPTTPAGRNPHVLSRSSGDTRIFKMENFVVGVETQEWEIWGCWNLQLGRRGICPGSRAHGMPVAVLLVCCSQS